MLSPPPDSCNTTALLVRSTVHSSRVRMGDRCFAWPRGVGLLPRYRSVQVASTRGVDRAAYLDDHLNDKQHDEHVLAHHDHLALIAILKPRPLDIPAPHPKPHPLRTHTQGVSGPIAVVQHTRESMHTLPVVRSVKPPVPAPGFGHGLNPESQTGC